VELRIRCHFNILSTFIHTTALHRTVQFGTVVRHPKEKPTFWSAHNFPQSRKLGKDARTKRPINLPSFFPKPDEARRKVCLVSASALATSRQPKARTSRAADAPQRWPPPAAAAAAPVHCAPLRCHRLPSLRRPQLRLRHAALLVPPPPAGHLHRRRARSRRRPAAPRRGRACVPVRPALPPRRPRPPPPLRPSGRPMERHGGARPSSRCRARSSAARAASSCPFPAG
jgi:hypothetical protein